jgi:hypothetical protein
MGWFMVTFSSRDIAAGKHIALQDSFINIFTALGAPRDAGMFKSSVSAYIYYFSPGAARIATQLIAHYAGRECPAPTRSEVCPSAVDASLEGIPFSSR